MPRDPERNEYTILDLLQEGATTVLYRGIRRSDRSSVILKTTRSDRPTLRDTERLRHEYEISRSLGDLSAVVKVEAFEASHGEAPTLVLEDFGGETLHGLLPQRIPIDRFLRLAIALARGLAAIHARNIVHRDINPRNIVVNAATGDVKITDFGLAAYAQDDPASNEAPAIVEGTPAYMSPEQAGRLNRPVGPASDLYSLGITLYELLIGVLPFVATDLVEWAHAHIARSAVSPSELRADVPAVLSSMVMKLIAKVPEERYPSAAALAQDLENCSKQWESTGRIEPFVLASHESSDRFRIPSTLYGRGPILAELLRAYDEVARTGTPQWVVVWGAPGVGKSALVGELRKPILAKGAGFLSGKFDTYTRDRPYAAFIQAFDELIRRVFTQSDQRIGEFGEQLERALGAHAALLTDLFPRLEAILGKRSPVPDLPIRDAQNRLHLAFRQFVGFFANEQHPLVLFLDDMQWADGPSLELVQHLVAHPDTGHLWLVGACRDNEGRPAALLSSLEQARALGVKVRRIALGALEPEHVQTLVSDTIHVKREEAQPLSEIVHEKTAGNPFFVIQFLNELHHDGLLHFHPPAGAFRWDLEEIRRREYADNVLDLMVAKLDQLRTPTREAVTVSACLGNTADPELVASILERPRTAIHTELGEAVNDRLMEHRRGRYVFLHDRIRQAAYSLLANDERARMHLRIGRVLIAHTPPAAIEDRLFEIAGHLTKAIELVDAPEEQQAWARLFFMAGRKAKMTTAYHTAAAFFASGRALVARHDWNASSELVFLLHLEGAECGWLGGDFADSEQLITTLLLKARTKQQTLAILEVQTKLLAVQGHMEKAAQTGLEALRLFGIHWPLHPTDSMVEDARQAVFEALGDRSIESLIDLPRVSHAETSDILRIAANVVDAAGYSDPKLSSLMACFIVQTSLTQGNDKSSPVGYVLFAQNLIQALGRYGEAYRFAALARDLVERHQIAVHRAKVRFVLGATIAPWTKPYRVGRDDVEVAFRAGVETGDLLWAAYTCGVLVSFALVAGAPLAEVDRDAEKQLEFARRTKFEEEIDYLIALQRCAKNLRGLTDGLSSWSGDDFDEASFEARVARQRIPIVRCLYETLKTQARVLSGDLEEAVTAAGKARELVWSMPSYFMVPEVYYWGALALAAHWSEVSSDEQKGYLILLEDHQRKLGEWKGSCPENFASKHALVVAEIARVTGRELDAERAYEQAIRTARSSGFAQCEAVACECAARFYRARGFAIIADAYLGEARAGYARWGAEGKLDQLERLHPQTRRELPSSFPSTIAVSIGALDAASILRASQSISSEVELPKLIQTLLRLALEHIGAERAALVLEAGSRLFVEAELRGDPRVQGGFVLESVPVEASSELPVSVIQYVQRTRETVLLDDAVVEPVFSSDPYVVERKPRSLLCLPILRQTVFVGMLYFENKLAAGAFASDRMAVIELLAGQIAILLDNAKLYEQLKRERDLMSRIMDTSPVGILVAERGGEVSFANRRAMEMLGLPAGSDPKRLGSLSEWQMTDEEGNVLYDARAQPVSLADQPIYGARVAVARGRSGRRLLSVNAARLSERADDLGAARIVAIFEDITEQLDTARERKQTQERLIVSDRLQSMGVLAAGIAHEINNPLTYVVSHLNLMARDIENLREWNEERFEKLRETLRYAEEGVGRIRFIVRDVMSFARVDDARRGPVDLRRVIELAANMAASEIRPRARLVTEFGETPLVDGNESRLGQVFLNLLINAAQAIAGESPERNEIRVVTRLDRAGPVVAEVRDTGSGMSPAVRSHIFDPFFTTKPVGVGTGLGLAICYTIVTSMGGHIEVESDVGAGSVFRVFLQPYSRAST